MERDDFEIESIIQNAVDQAVEARWDDERIREAFEIALERAMEPE